MYIALVDQTINGGNPCVGGYAAAAPDSLHSGPQQASAGTKLVTIPQQDNNSPPQELYLDGTRTFSVCYAESDGAGARDDATWAYSGSRTSTSHDTFLNNLKSDSVPSVSLETSSA